MKLSELKKIVEDAQDFFSEDYEVEIYDENGESIEPYQMAKPMALGKLIFDT